MGARLGPLFGVSRNVFFLGLTSLLTDTSSEMVNAVLPLYLTLALHFAPWQYGIFDGLFQGFAGVLRLWGGLTADRQQWHKHIAAAGYAASAACKAGLVVVGPVWLPTTLLLIVDRLSKGLRTPPRDALIALSSERGSLGAAFGVHRAMDTAGLLIGPVVAFAILARAPSAFDAVFVVSCAFALAGLGALVLLVQNRTGEARSTAASTSRRAVSELLQLPAFRTVLIAAGLLGFATIGDALVYLVLQRQAQLDPSMFPLLPFTVAVVYLLLAIPAGRLADRFGRARILLAGYGALGGMYAVLAWPMPGTLLILSSLVLLGAYYACTEGVLMALASEALPGDHVTTGLALLTTVTAVVRLFASTLFGLLWSWRGPTPAAAVFLCGLTAAFAMAAALLRRRGQ